MKALAWFTVIACSCAIVLGSVPAATQSLNARVDLKAPAPRLPSGKPDFSGVWARPGTQDLTRTFTNANGTSNKGEPNPLPFTSWGQAQWDNYNPNKDGDYAGSCMPFGWIRSFTPHPMQILQNNEYIAFLFEQSTMFQAVNTEGLPHRQDWPPTWFGDSRGRWEGDTLIIDVVNMNGWTRLDTLGHPMSDQSKLTMTFRRPDFGHIEFKWVLDDPKTYTRPISNERVFVLTPDVEVMEYSCMEGNMLSLLQGGITPWTGPTIHDTNQVYGTERDWGAYDETRPQKWTGVIREANYNGPFGTIKIDAAGRLLSVVLAPPPRMDFRGLREDNLNVGSAVSVEAFPSKNIKEEVRATLITIGGRTFELR
jgi:hypothetical protein